MSNALDLLLDETREPAPFDEDFVQNVMSSVHAYEHKRLSRRVTRRPIAFGIAAALLATGGTVAAVVGTNPQTPADGAGQSTAPTRITASTRPDATDDGVVSTPGRTADGTSSASPTGSAVDEANGLLSAHTSFVLDPKTGLRLQTEAYTNDFIVGREHRVTLTLENTGTKPVTMSGAKDCQLQVMAYPAGESDSATYQDPDEYTGNFEWLCAGSQSDPRADALSESFLLAPGERISADAYVALPQPGEWKIVGMCRCSYARVEGASPSPKSDPLSDLFEHALPAPLIPEGNEGENLVTPAIRADAR
jgi:hypothetical protein